MHGRVVIIIYKTHIFQWKKNMFWIALIDPFCKCPTVIVFGVVIVSTLRLKKSLFLFSTATPFRVVMFCQNYTQFGRGTMDTVKGYSHHKPAIISVASRHWVGLHFTAGEHNHFTKNDERKKKNIRITSRAKKYFKLSNILEVF